MDLKSCMAAYLDQERAALLAKVEGLSERELRMPRTPTGTNLLGIIKHCVHCEHGYFGVTFGRELEDSTGLLDLLDDEADPQADWYATASESAASVIDLYERVIRFARGTIEALDLDSPGRVPWWGPQKQDVTLGQIMTHMHADLARHAGQADILRESIDGSAGWRSAGDNLPDHYDFPAYVATLRAIAERF